VQLLSAATLTACLMPLGAGPAGATACDTWIGGDGNFGMASNWSTGQVPGSSDDACITATTTTSPKAAADTYTVTLNGGITLHSLTLGGPNGTQTLVTASGGELDVGDSTVNAHGVLTLGDAGGDVSVLKGCDPNAPCFVRGVTLTNSGLVKTVVGGGGNRYLRINLVNTPGGTVDLAAATFADASGGATSITNNGTFKIDASGALTMVNNGESFFNGGGTLTNNGGMSMQGNGDGPATFTQRGGTGSGNPVVLMSPTTLDDDLGAASALFTVTQSAILTGTGPNPGIAAGQLVTVASNAEADVLGNFANAGTITLGNAATGESVLKGCDPSAFCFVRSVTLTNSGLVKTVVGGGSNRYLRINLVNTPDGTVDLGGPTYADASGGATSITNNGTFKIDASGALTMVNNGESFFNGGGTLTNDGGMSMQGNGDGPATFTQRGGTGSGDPVVLKNPTTLNDDLGAAQALFTVAQSTILTGTGPNPGIAAGQLVTVASNAEADMLGNFANAGTITLGNADGGDSVLMGCDPNAFCFVRGVTLTNSGTLKTVVGGGGNRYLRINLVNAPGGAVDLAGPTMANAGGGSATLTNNGSFTIDPSGSLTFTHGAGNDTVSFTNSGGSLTNNGDFTFINSGTFTERGGSESGNPVVLKGSTLDDDVGAKPASFTLITGNALTGSGPDPGVAAGQVVTVAGNSSANVVGNYANAGTITLGNADSGDTNFNGCDPSDCAVHSVTLTNSGLLKTVVGGGGLRALHINVVNTPGGSVDIGAPTFSDAGGGATSFTNNGIFGLDAGFAYAISNGSTFSQGPGGTFATTIDANAVTFGQLTGGGDSVSLDGTLKVATVGSPAPSSAWPIISGASRSGQFATYDLGSKVYKTQYPADGVTLIAAARPNVTTAVINNATGNPPSGAEVAGAAFHDTATVTGIVGFTPTGALTYRFFANGTCSGASSAQQVALAGGIVPDSAPTGKLAAGAYSYLAAYSGATDPVYVDSESPCEPFAVGKAASRTTTQVINDATSGPPAGTDVTGAAFHDTAAVNGVAGFTPTGTLTYRLFNNGSCTGTPASSQQVSLSGGLVSNSSSSGPLGAGSYSYQAVYGGDGNYAGSTSACESFTLGKASSATSTQVINNATGQPPTGSEVVGAAFHDTASVVGVPGFPSTGSLTYSLFTNTTCTGTPTSAQQVTLSGGLAPQASSTGPLAAGSYSYQAVYGGDGNYATSISSCEPFGVGKAFVPPACVVPNVVGRKLETARARIARAHCRVGAIRRAYSAKVRKHRVISEHPAAGTRLRNGGRVNLVVSRGKRARPSLG